MLSAKSAVIQAQQSRNTSWYSALFKALDHGASAFSSDQLLNHRSWRSIRANSVAMQFPAMAPNRKIYILTYLPPDLYNLRYFLTCKLISALPFHWYATSSNGPLFCESQSSIINGNINGIKEQFSEIKRNYISFNEYVVKIDVVSFYANINHELLISTIKQLLDKHPKTLDPVLKFLPDLLRFRLQSIVDPKQNFMEQGLPIGCATDRFFANVYLHSADEFLKHQQVKFTRHSDDITIFSNDQKTVETTIKSLAVILKSLGLSYRLSCNDK